MLFRSNFFKIEVIDNEQLNSLPGAAGIDEAMRQPFTGFRHLANIRMPLLELPLFQSWGQALVAEDGKTLVLLLACEPHKGIHRCLISYASGKYFVTTDFGAQQAKFPDSIEYLVVDRRTSGAELLGQHYSRIGDTATVLNEPPWSHLETMINTVIAFLESENVKQRTAGVPENILSNGEAIR